MIVEGLGRLEPENKNTPAKKRGPIPIFSLHDQGVKMRCRLFCIWSDQYSVRVATGKEERDRCGVSGAVSAAVYVHGANISFSDLIPEINLFYEKVSATKW
jgi:hypothetical protein